MKNIKFTIMQHGWIENDYAWNEAVPYPLTKDNREAKARWVKVPSYSVLIKHPDIGNILYDTGSFIGDEDNRLPESAKQINSLTIQREEFLDRQLEKLNLSVKDIDLIILSHMHWDHAGGVGFFEGTLAGQHIIAPKADFAFGLMQSHKSPDRFVDGYLRENFHFKNVGYDLIEEDTYIADGVRILMASGHTPAICTLYIETEMGNYLFVSDTASMKNIVGPPLKYPGILYDKTGYERSIKHLENYAKEHKAKIIFGHDIEQIASMKKAPYFYG